MCRSSSSLHLFSVFVLACLLGAGWPSDAAAQDRGDGSIYSRYGVGELKHFSSSQIEAMGGGGTAMRTFNYLNLLNPASWSDQYLTRASAGVRYQHLVATDAADNTSRLTLGALDAVHFSFPILERELGIALSFIPYSRANYQVQIESPLETNVAAQAPDTALLNFEGRGGLQQFSAGLGYRFNNALSVGASADVIFGIIEDARRTSFPRAGGYTTTNVTTATRMAGVTGTLGGIYSGGSVLRDQDELSMGASFTLPAYLSGNQVQTLGESLNRDTLGTVEEGDVTLPLRMRLGTAYRPGQRWTLLLDGAYEPWSQFDSSFPAGRRFGTAASQNYTDRLRLSAGVEVVPAGNDVLASYLSRVGYRLGGYYEQMYMQPLVQATAGASPTEIQTFAVTGGFSLPTPVSGTRLDLNLEVGTRGTTSQQLVRDVFYKISAYVNVGERWFQERRLR